LDIASEEVEIGTFCSEASAADAVGIEGEGEGLTSAESSAIELNGVGSVGAFCDGGFADQFDFGSDVIIVDVGDDGFCCIGD